MLVVFQTGTASVSGGETSGRAGFVGAIPQQANGDYDADDDGLIEIRNLDQLNAVRYDLDGDGVADTDSDADGYANAFTDVATGMGCPAVCAGYELMVDLDFGAQAESGPGWLPIGVHDAPFMAVFDGNNRTIHNLYIARDGTTYVGLFGFVGTDGNVRNLRLNHINVSGYWRVGGLVGYNGGTVQGSSVTGTGAVMGRESVGGLAGDNYGTISRSSSVVRVIGGSGAGPSDEIRDNAGGLVGYNGSSGTISSSHAAGEVSGEYDDIGGLVGDNAGGMIFNTYSIGDVSGRHRVGGLVGQNRAGGTISDSYWDIETSRQSASAGGEGKTTRQLQSPTGYTGIYATWNVDMDNADGDNALATGRDDPWDFGTSSEYPTLRGVGTADASSSMSLPISDWMLLGSAERTASGSVVLTPAEKSQIGYLIHPHPVSSEQFNVAFSFEIGGGTGADGLALVVTPNLPDMTVGGGGGNIGSPQLKGGVAVAFDTWLNRENEAQDSSNNHVEINLTGASPLTLAAKDLTQPLRNNNVFDAEVSFSHGHIEVYLSNAPAEMPRTLVLSHTIPNFVPFEGYIGFVATTGGSTDRHIIHSATITAKPKPVPTPVTDGDYDVDDDGLIEVSNLAQLDAIRYDLDGNGAATDPAHGIAFPGAVAGMGCPAAGCAGYELIADLDFDTNGNGEADAGDAHWNDGAGWRPISQNLDLFSLTPFTATFDGGGHTISNLYIRREDSHSVGLFGGAVGSHLRDVVLESFSVSGNSSVGGLVGGNSGTVTASHATGNVSGDSSVGGLAGSNSGTITDSHTMVSVSGKSNVGGLVGWNSGTVAASYAAGSVSGDFRAGGLVGSIGGERYNADGTVTIIPSDIALSYATGSVSGGDRIGGLVGSIGTGSTVTASYATGSVWGGHHVGGLAGTNSGTVTDSYATGTATGAIGEFDYGVGGLVGWNHASISNSYATGAVTGEDAVGGLVGGNQSPASISNSYATGVSTGYYGVGGLVGTNHNSYVGNSNSYAGISNSYAMGAATGDEGAVGGLAGSNDGDISNSYAMGAATGEYFVGGLVGKNDSSAGISNSYATGVIIGDRIVGGLLGDSTGTTTASYWDTRTSGQSNGVGSGVATGVSGKTTAELQSPTDATGIYAIWHPAIWDFGTSSQYPMLRNIGATSPAQLGPTVLMTAPQLYWVDEEAQKIQRTLEEDGAWTVADLATSAQGVAMPGSIALDLANGKVYWTDDGATGSACNICRANLDGSGRVENVKAGLSDPVGIALDLDAGYLYWADRTHKKIYRSNENINQKRLQISAQTLVNNLGEPYQIALDTANGQMYWTERGEDTSKIRRVALGALPDLEGDDVTDIAGFGWVAPENPFGLALDPVAGKMYWTERLDGGDVVARADFDGQNRQILARSEAYSLSGIAVDVGTGEIYWTDEKTGTVRRTDPNNSDREVEDVVTGLRAPEGIAVARSPDAAALRALYEATDGENWTNNDGWLSAAPIGKWHGVTTDGDGRVTKLILPENRLHGVLPEMLGNLNHLRTLNLSRNQLIGSIPFQLSSFDDLAGCEAIWPKQPDQGVLDVWKDYTGSLGNLEELDLSDNRLSGVISSTLCSLANLEALDLGSNQLSQAIPAALGDLTHLDTLRLDDNQLSGSIPEVLGNLENLEVLVLGNNNLTGDIPPELARLTNLETLTLRGNRLEGEIPDLSALSDTLRWLNLEHNELNGEIPPWLGDFTELRGLGLGHNRLNGTIPSALGKLTNLRVLYLDDQYRFRGQTPTGSPAYVESQVNNDKNYLHGQIPPEFGNLANLEVLSLSQNRLTEQIPPQLGDLSNLRLLYLYENDLSGSIPRQLGKLYNLEMLNLRRNRLSGTITVSLGDLANLQGLYLHGNELSGSIPFQLGKLSKLEALNLSQNELSGSIPAELGDLASLTRLYLFDNDLSGPIPSQLGELSDLKVLSVSQNDLSKGIPAELGDLTSLTRLYLYKNNDLSGLIPRSVTELPNLIVLNINDTQLSVVPTENVAAIQRDREALVALYNAAGVGWTNKDNWGSDEPIAKWEGVTVATEHDPNRPNRTGRIIELDLQGKISKEGIYDWIETIPDNAEDPSASLFWLESLKLHIITDDSGKTDDLIHRLAFITSPTNASIDITTYYETVTGSGTFKQAGIFEVLTSIASSTVKTPVAGYTWGARYIKFIRGGATGGFTNLVVNVADSPAGKVGTKLNLAGTIITSTMSTELAECVAVEAILRAGLVESVGRREIDWGYLAQLASPSAWPLALTELDLGKCASAIDNFITDAISSAFFGINFWELGADALGAVGRWFWE